MGAGFAYGCRWVKKRTWTSRDGEALEAFGEEGEVGHGEVGVEGGAVVVDLVEDDDAGDVVGGVDVEALAAGLVGEGALGVHLAEVEECLVVVGGDFELGEDDEGGRVGAHTVSLPACAMRGVVSRGGRGWK